VSLSGAGAGSHNKISVATSALVDGSTSSLIGDAITVSAEDISEIDVTTAAASIGIAIGKTAVAIALGIALALNEISSDVTASAAGLSQLKTNAGNLSVTAKRGGSIQSTAAAASFAAGFGAVGVAVSGA